MLSETASVIPFVQRVLVIEAAVTFQPPPPWAHSAGPCRSYPGREPPGCELGFRFSAFGDDLAGVAGDVVERLELTLVVVAVEVPASALRPFPAARRRELDPL